jgi:hypothetical protein
MKSRLSAALTLALALSAGPSLAQIEATSDFSALAGIEAQALTQQELDAIEGAKVSVADLMLAAASIQNATLRNQVTAFLSKNAKKLAERLDGLRHR